MKRSFCVALGQQTPLCTAMTSSQEHFLISVHTAPAATSGTFNHLWLTLIGSQGESPPIAVTQANQHLLPGSVCVVRLRSERSLGRVVLVRLRLAVRPGFPDLDWLCEKVEVLRTQGDQVKVGGAGLGEAELFTCGRWLRASDGVVELRSGQLCLVTCETEDKLRDHRTKELCDQQKSIRWRVFFEGVPHCVDMTGLNELGPNLSYKRQSRGVNLHYLAGFSERAESWKSFSELEILFSLNGNQNDVAKFVQAHWKEDWFFGHQCLNGCNPLSVRRTRLLPPNLPVTCDMLRPFLPEDSSLEQELERGNMFLLDYNILDEVPANVINGRQHYVSAPLCLLHLTREGQLKPIAIQLQQTPGPQNPVFVPSDPGCVWLLAKTWVRSADFQVHQLSSHFLRTHLLGEVCCTATLRQLPEVHPLHQLLMPHIKTTLQINIQARSSLLASKGVFDKAIGCGADALPVLLSRSAERLCYSALCVPEDLEDRGLHTLPQCSYAQDARRVWDVLHRFVMGWLGLCYHGDGDVETDSELQCWIDEIYTHGFLQRPESGCPQSFQTKTDLCKFVTMVIFSVSALHAAVNFSQVDFDLWMPNSPPSMARPPPQTKSPLASAGQDEEEEERQFLSFLLDVNSTCSVLYTLTLLSQPALDFVSLCQYRGTAFSFGAPQRLVQAVQAELRALSDDITARNRKQDIPYKYLNPDWIENDLAI